MAAVKLSERERRLALTTAGFAIFYFFYQFFLTPKWAEVAKLKEKARVQRLELRVAEGKLKLLGGVGQGAASFKYEVSREEKALEVLRSISQATAQSGLDLNSIRPMLSAGGEGMKFSLSGTGKYRNIYDFLTILRGIRVLILVDAMNITAGGGKESELNVEMTLTAYD
ncbi:hypothetical protein HZB08_00350 [Candidatus Saganbacteria bacterium]|uniref:Type II secretion system protein M n=1 Tax=Candidatus Saganbacteria bacterium TaxID=2575572 RepID=A0A9D6UJE9_UNCSA|nr:hypothetical protein [Candidatus Saganbacteria bacterium]